MDGRVAVQLGVEGGCDDVRLTDGNVRAVKDDERLDRWSVRDDLRRTDEREGNCGTVGKRGFGVEAPELTSVGVAFDRDIQE